MKITLDIPDNQVSFFMELMLKLGFTKIDKNEALPEAHRLILDERMNRLASEEGTITPWGEFRKELEDIL